MDGLERHWLSGHDVEVIDENRDDHRRPSKLKGRAWIYPGERLILFDRKVYVVTIEGPFERE